MARKKNSSFQYNRKTMANPSCQNTSLGNNYSGPMLAIGLFIGIASLVCLLLVLLDFICGIRCSKPWIPCRYFSLRSISLILLAILIKIPSDLTTPMPGPLDQLSKVTGTSVLTICMAYSLPSIRGNTASESLLNMGALTTIVVTIVVDICLQISTGLIFIFIPEHYIIMSCMLTVLVIMWQSTWYINSHKLIRMARKNNIFQRGNGSMFRRLKLCYLHCYTSEPQFLLSSSFHASFVIVPCFLCLIVVIEVCVRSIRGHEFTFCNGLSDYKWSVWIVALSQISVTLLASLTIAFRLGVGYLAENDMNIYRKSMDEEVSKLIRNNTPFFKAGIWDIMDLVFRKTAIFWSSITYLVLVLPLSLILMLVLPIISCFKNENSDSEAMQEYNDLLSANGMRLQRWTLTKCVEDINRQMHVRTENNSMDLLKQLLSDRRPSRPSLQELTDMYDFKEGNEISSLYLVFLVKISSVSTPATLSGHLAQCLRGVFDIIHFIDANTNSRKKCRFAKAMWMGEEFERVEGSTNEQSQYRPHLVHTRDIFQTLRTEVPQFIWAEVEFLVKFINSQQWQTVEELFNHMEQLFVDMLHIYLCQLPDAISKQVMDSQVEEYEEKLGLMLKFLCKIEPLDDKVQWPFPVGNITSLRTDAPLPHRRIKKRKTGRSTKRKYMDRFYGR